jgi:hypothetical protein
MTKFFVIENMRFLRNKNEVHHCVSASKKKVSANWMDFSSLRVAGITDQHTTWSQRQFEAAPQLQQVNSEDNTEIIIM